MGIIKQLLFMFFFALLIIFLMSQVHEVTHKQIGKYYGCDGTIVWDFMDGNSINELLSGEQTAFMSTHWDSNCQMTESQTLAHSINEVIGYNVMLVLEVMLILMMMIIMILVDGKDVVVNIRKKRNRPPNIFIIK